MSANEVQVGGEHYRTKPIQPWDFITQNGLGYLEGCIVKYVSRHRQKGGIEDLKKAKHYLDKLIELESSKATIVSLDSSSVYEVKQDAVVAVDIAPFGFKPDGTPYKRRPYGKRSKRKGN